MTKSPETHRPERRPDGATGVSGYHPAVTSPLNPFAILAALGVRDVQAATPVTGGADTVLWRVERGPDVFALRVFRPEQAAACRRELAAMAAVGGHVPVPRVLAVGAWHDRPALLLSWCRGEPLASALGREPWRLWAVGRRWGRALALIHRVRASDLVRAHPVDWIAWAGPAGEVLRSRLGTAGLRTDVLLHLDYHPLNVLVADGRVSAVLDWANVRAGDPRADVARTITILRLSPLPPGITRLVPPMMRALEAAFSFGYRQVAGPLGDLAPFHAWAGAFLVRDLGPRADVPGGWVRDANLDPARRWAAYWSRRAGVRPQVPEVDAS
ncbi:MAG: aminoglycoside phosphotransferase family protein [Chloroflexota bacterium]|nr:aminoglycoside phosphotransferase family protein [Chloroflexota bacterium]